MVEKDITQKVLEAYNDVFADMTGDHRFEEAFSDDSEGSPKTMCDVLDRVEKRGKAEGENLILTLMQKLVVAGRVEDAQKASNDAAYCAKLLTEFGLTKLFILYIGCMCMGFQVRASG